MNKVCSCFVFQDDNFSLSLLNELCLKYGLQTHLSHSPLPQKMEELREFLRREIKKELKIKEGAENLRKVARDRKSVSDVNRMVKSSNTKLTDMQQELQELESQILVSSSSSSSSAARGDKHTPNSSLSGEGKLFFKKSSGGLFFLFSAFFVRVRGKEKIDS